MNNNYASFGKRFLALLLDGVALWVLSFILDTLFHTSITGHAGSAISMSFSGPTVLVPILYYTASWVYWDGATLGKKIMKIKIQTMDGQPISWVTAILRYVGYFISTIPLGLGYFWMLWDNNKQTWHDKIAKTVVVNA